MTDDVRSLFIFAAGCNSETGLDGVAASTTF
jgi:hypothetical protein